MATLVVVTGFVLVYQATMLDSRNAARQEMAREDRGEPGPGARLRFTASAYCTGEITASGLAPRMGIAAADPKFLPAGSVIQVAQGAGGHDGIYTVLDTGAVVKGRHIDIYMRNCADATAFGRRTVHVFILRLGWNPTASGPNLLDLLLPWREKPVKKP